MKQLFLFAGIAGSTLLSSCKQQPSETDKAPAEVVIEKTVEFPDDALRIVAIVTLKDAAFTADFEKAVAEIVAGSRAEEGCIYYEFGKSNDPLTYSIIEVWESQEAIDIHNETAHFKAFIEAIEGKVDLTVCLTNKLH